MRYKGKVIINMDVGGSGVVARKISETFNLKLVNFRESAKILNTELIFVTQPKAILNFLRYYKHPNIFYIFDLHPKALPPAKRIIYYMIVFAAWLLAQPKCMIPYGPLTRNLLHKRFKHVDWTVFVSDKFERTTEQEESSFVFLGKRQKSKGFKVFNSIRSDLTKLHMASYSNAISDNNIYFWWGLQDSYGLLWRELAKSHFMVLCCRPPEIYDDVTHGVYFIGNWLSEADVKLIRWHSIAFPSSVKSKKGEIMNAIFS